MATTTAQASIWNTTNNAARTTAAFTPSPNELLIAITGWSGNDAVDAVTDSESGTWDLVGSFRSHSTSVTGGLRMWARTAGVSGASMTVTATPNATTCTGGGLAVLSVSGASGYGSAAIRAQAGQADQAAGTPAPVLPQAALTTSTLIGAVMTNTNGSANCAPPAGWAGEDYDLGYNQPATGLEVCHRDTGETNTTITFGAATPSQFGALVIEILPAAGTADLTVTLYQGVTAKASKVITDTPNATFTNDSFTLTGGEADSITDYNDLRLGFKATATSGLRLDVSWAELEVPGSPPSALVPAATVTAVASVPTPTVAGTCVATPAMALATASIPTPVVGVSATTSPPTAAAVSSIASPTAAATANWSGDAYFEQYGVGGSVSAVASVPTPTVIATSADTTAIPATVAVVATVPTPIILVPDAIVAPATVAAVVSIPAPTVRGTASTAPATVASLVTVPAPTAQGAAQPTPATIAGTGTIPTPTVRGTVIVTPATVAATTAVPTPVVIAGGTVLVPAATVAAVVSIPTPTVIAGAITIPATVLTTSTVGASTLKGAAVASPAVVSAVVAVPTPTVFGGVPGDPVRDPQAKLIGVEALAALVDAEGKAVLI